MHITISDVIGERTIDLPYPIRGTEVAVVSLFSGNIQYEFIEPWLAEFPGSGGTKRIKAGTCTRRELIDLVEGKIGMTQFDEAPKEQVGRTNKLEGITEIVLSLDELDNTDNLENGKPSSTLLAYHVTAHDDFTNFEPCAPQYKRLKDEEFNSLTLRMMHKESSVITGGPATTVVLHVR